MNTNEFGDPDGTADLHARLQSAAQRLHTTAPDDDATRHALRRLHEQAAIIPPQIPTRRAWTPVVWAAGIAAAAVIGVVALAARSPQETIREIPADSTPPTLIEEPPSTEFVDGAPTTVGEGEVDGEVVSEGTPPPNTDPVVTEVPTGGNERGVVYEYRSDHCFVMSLDAPDRRIGRASGCIPLDAFGSEHLYLTLMEDELYRIAVAPGEFDDAGRPLLTIKTFPEWSSASCGLINAFPPEVATGGDASTLVIELIGCREGDRPVALAARIPQEEGLAPAPFTTASRYTPDGAELTGPVPVTGLRGVNAYFGEPLPGVRCMAVTQFLPTGTQWREQCWDTAAGSPPAAIAQLSGYLAQLDVEPDGTVHGAIIDDLGVQFAGCAGADLHTLVETVLLDHPGSMFNGFRCDDTNGVMSSPGVVLHDGRADGGYDVFERDDRASTWTYVNTGTAIEPPFPYPLPPYELWSSWPGDAGPYVSDRRDVSFGGSGSAVDNISAVTGAIEDGADPEFPPNPQVLAVWPEDGIPSLVVVREDVGGDDSVSGLVHYVHVTGGPELYTVADWYTSAICARGGGPDYCV